MRLFAFALALLALFATSAHIAVAATLDNIGPRVSDWNVQSIVRSIDLGSVASLTDAHVIRLPSNSKADEPTTDEDVRPYYFALSSPETEHVTGLEATARYGPGVLSTQRAVLKVKEHGPMELEGSAYTNGNATSSRPVLYSVKLPVRFLQRSETEERLADITINVVGHLVHASKPLPASVAQGESQYMLWKGSAAPITPYGAGTARVKVKSPQATVLSYSTEPELAADQMVKSGSTITFGPYKNLPAMQRLVDVAELPSEARVHFLHNAPVLTFVEADREARISHLRNRMTFEDKLWLRNDGATLKGHFSRAQHQLHSLVQRVKTHTLTNVVMHLPPGTQSAYFVDESGNVSTSNFRASSPSEQHITTPAHLLSEYRASILDFRPRYPLLGGWNYTCSVGWQVKLTDGWLTPTRDEKDKEGARRFTVHVPFLPAVKDVAVDDATLRVVLPEGAQDIKFVAPFPVDVSIRRQWRFLDTAGKPVLELRKKRCSDRCGAMVKVDYTLGLQDEYRKFLVFGFGILLIITSTKLRKGSSEDAVPTSDSSTSNSQK